MVPPSLIAGGLFGLALLAAFGMTYYKGEQACEKSHLVKELRAKAELQALRIKQFEDASIESKTLTDEALKQAKEQEQKYEILLQTIKDDNSTIVCVDDGFLRNLERTRGKR